jgi:hypothetical protein
MSEEHSPVYLMFKLASGSPFIIAEVCEETTVALKTKLPLIFSFHDSEDGEIYVNASKFMQFAEDDVVVFDKRNVHAFATPKQNLLQYYISWRAGATQEAFDQVEAMMLDCAVDPTLATEEPLDFEGMTPSSETVFH